MALTGLAISHYRIIRKLGSGGMGVVHEAEEARLNRAVALKCLPESPVMKPRAVERFQREAWAASALNHPNICTVYDVGQHDGNSFLVTELLEDQTLRNLIAPFTTACQSRGVARAPDKKQAAIDALDKPRGIESCNRTE